VAPDSRTTFRFCGIQRLMQALGAYGFLGLVKGNKTFLDHIPAAMDSLRGLVAEIPDLERLSIALDRVS
jgi:N-acetylmuramate 1-kinase